jgi:ferredoxin-NADP reductase
MRAMLPTFQAAGVDVVLIYSVRTPAEAAFTAEFQEAAAAGGVRIIYTVTGACSAQACAHYGRKPWLPMSPY